MTFVPDRSGVNPLDRRYSSSNRTVANSAAVAAATPLYPGEIIRAQDTGRPYRALSAAAGAWGGGAVANPASGIPTGVTLQSVDGGADYYSRNGFTYAAAAGWDSPDFFPICLFLERIDNTANFNTWIDLGLNVALGIQGNSPALLQMRNNPGKIWAIPQANELLAQILPTNGGVLGPETIGLHAADEPASTAVAWQYLESTPNIYQDNRLWQITYLHTAIDFGDVGGTAIYDVMASSRITPNGSQRHLALGTTDHYFCAGAHYGIKNQVSSKFGRGAIFTQPEITEVQCRRPCHYGDYVRFMRSGNPNTPGSPSSKSFFQVIGDFPIGTWIETGAPYTENIDANFVIKPAEINAGVWSTIINGARMIQYFSQSDAGFGDSLISGTFWKTPLIGETVSNYDQVKATNALVKSLASVLNSPFANGYVTVSPAAQYLSQTLDDAGFDVMAKFGPGGKYYVFAMPRVAAVANQSATFTIKNTGGTVATVINEARTRPITGGTTFTDTFATGNTVHIYRID
jgi:hypothetical protein